MAQLLRRESYFQMVASVRAPALIVQGDRDRLVNVESARALAALRPDWRIEILEGVGHVPQLEVPERFLAVVEPWLAERVAA
jgi:pimeloyl-ACP methyl ester carboxylesterase